MDVSIGVMAYNEENTIGKLLDHLLIQKTNNVRIKEIIVISSGSKDKTENIVIAYSKRNSKIKLIRQEKRMGKVSAINVFLKNAKCDILALISADIIPKDDLIENLCLPLIHDKIGIVASRPMPMIKKKSILSYAVYLQWLLHHKISRKTPKFGEAIAFKKIFTYIEDTAVDEEFIAMLIKNSGLKGIYVDEAIVFNQGPTTINDFLMQRRRILCGHLQLKKKTGYCASTLRYSLVISEAINVLTIKTIPLFMSAVVLEMIGRTLGYYDYLTHKNHNIWKISPSTKK